VHIALIRNVDENGTRISDIAKRAGMTKQATGQLVAEFVGLGYIKLVPDSEDGRAKIARYTAKGKKLLVAIVSAIEETETAVANAIGSAQTDALKATLARLLSAQTPPPA
jgi:DNA-binding MarR family transcriptional regulator